MYSKVVIENFRGLKHVEIDGLKRINILVGKNNCGKTSVLEAMLLLGYRTSPLGSMLLPRLRGHGIPADKNEFAGHLEESWRSMFSGMQTGAPIQVIGTLSLATNGSKALVRSLRIASAPVLGVPAGRELTPASESASSLEFQLEEKALGTETASLQNSVSVGLGGVQWSANHGTPDRIFLLPADTTLVLSDALEIFQKLWLAKQEGVILKQLQAVDPRIREVSQSGSEVVVDSGLDRRLPLWVQGGGTVRLFQIATLAHWAAGGMLLIDEIDGGLHHSVMEKLWAFLAVLAAEHGVQVVATTHSDEMMRSGLEMLSEVGEAPGLFRLNRLDDGNHRVTSYPPELHESLLSGPFEARG